MGVWERILLGFFVGTLCGIIPLVYCIIKHMKIMSAVGMSVTVASGVLFSALSNGIWPGNLCHGVGAVLKAPEGKDGISVPL